MSHDRVWWDLGRASSDVIEGHCSKHSRDILTGFQALWKHIWGICVSYCVEIGQDFQTKEVYHLATQYGVYLRLARLRCIYIFSIWKCGSSIESARLLSRSTICRPIWLEKVKIMGEELTYNHWGVIKMTVNTNTFIGKFVFSLRFCRSAVCMQRI